MRIVFILRLYSSLMGCLESRTWSPVGMPAIVKLIERISRDKISADIYLLSRIKSCSLEISTPFCFRELPGVRFHALPYIGNTSFINNILNHVRHWLYLSRRLSPLTCDLIYCDRAHAWIGGKFAYRGMKVVLRMLGVADIPHRKRFRYGVIPDLDVCGFKAPFVQVICSMDGSPVEWFVRKCLAPGVPSVILRNGTDCFTAMQKMGGGVSEERGNDAPVSILFVGRLEPDKGVCLFLKALRLLVGWEKSFKAHIVGDGSQRFWVNEFCAQGDMKHHVVIHGSVPHTDIVRHLESSDIFISLNRLGNQSNVVLEAMSAGKCIVTYDADEACGRDLQFQDDCWRRAFCLVDPQCDPEKLAKILVDLMNNRGMISEKSRLVSELARKVLTTWDRRMDSEMDILRKSAGIAIGDN